MEIYRLSRGCCTRVRWRHPQCALRAAEEEPVVLVLPPAAARRVARGVDPHVVLDRRLAQIRQLLVRRKDDVGLTDRKRSSWDDWTERWERGRPQ